MVLVCLRSLFLGLRLIMVAILLLRTLRLEGVHKWFDGIS